MSIFGVVMQQRKGNDVKTDDFSASFLQTLLFFLFCTVPSSQIPFSFIFFFFLFCGVPFDAA
jgi:hypothetical protein